MLLCLDLGESRRENLVLSVQCTDTKVSLVMKHEQNVACYDNWAQMWSACRPSLRLL